MKPLTIVKLGGSAITDKSRECTPNLPVIQRAVEQLATYHGPIILLHGGGSYAHPVVIRSNLQRGYLRPSQREAVSTTELNLDQLSRIIGVSLVLNGRPFVPLHPISLVTLKNGRPSRVFLDPVRSSLALGFIPLLHGDIAFDHSRGWSILSADRLASLLAAKLEANRVLFGCDVDGLYTKDPKGSKNASLIVEVNRQRATSLIAGLGSELAHDASGGMRGKALESLRIAQAGAESVIFNLARPRALIDALNDRLSTCTKFLPWS